PEKFAGKRVKCPQCTQPALVPEPQNDQPEENNILLEHLLESPPEDANPGPDSAEDSEDNTCPQCHNPIDPSAVLCINCGGKIVREKASQAAEKDNSPVGQSEKVVAEIPRIIIGALLGAVVGAAIWGYIVYRSGNRFVYLSVVVAITTTFGIRLALWSLRRNIKFITLALGLLCVIAAKLFTAQWVAIPIVVECQEILRTAVPTYSHGEIVTELAETDNHFFSVVCRKLEKDGVFIPRASELAQKRQENLDIHPSDVKDAGWAFDKADMYVRKLNDKQKCDLIEEIEPDVVDQLYNESNREYFDNIARLEGIVNHPYTYFDHLVASVETWYYDLIFLFIASVCAYCLGAELDMRDYGY
ncbi:MAG: hypothetical protein GY869_20630, partial [Planctomycetes bacterium]|nr:hypothetical protein [Planctomycetota bacterium]